MTSSNVEQKIKKLQAMIEDGATTVNEKEVAGKLLQKLVELYCIDLDALNAEKPDEINYKVSYLRWTQQISPNLHTMASELALTFSCHCFKSSSVCPGYIVFVFTGREEMREQVDYLFTYLVRMMKRFFKLSAFNKDRRKLEAGFCDGVVVKLKEIRENNKKYYGPQSQALMRIDNEFALSKEFANKQFSIHYSYAQPGQADKYGIGYNAGKNVAMNKGIKSGNGPIAKGILK
jgi:hypothetical protein